jgi:hypothetical protein
MVFWGMSGFEPRELAVTSTQAANLSIHPPFLLFTFQIFKKVSFNKNLYEYEQSAGIRIYATLKNWQKNWK